jgi:hypothetical protein
MRKRILFVVGSVVLLIAGYVAGSHSSIFAYTGQDYAREVSHGVVPKSYGRLAAAIPDSIGTGLVFEDTDGVIRFVSANGSDKANSRYDRPGARRDQKSYGHLMSAVESRNDGSGL